MNEKFPNARAEINRVCNEGILQGFGEAVKNKNFNRAYAFYAWEAKFNPAAAQTLYKTLQEATTKSQ